MMMLCNQWDRVICAKYPDTKKKKRSKQNETNKQTVLTKMELNPLILPYGHLRRAQAASDVTIQYSYKAEELLSSISDQHHP